MANCADGSLRGTYARAPPFRRSSKAGEFPMRQTLLLATLVAFFGCGETPPAPGPTCTDSVRNGTEADVDCGGTCGPCANGKSCSTSGDCSTNNCVAQVCRAVSCTDGVRNGAETDADCGGGTCPTCADTLVCVAGTDCSSGTCTQGRCASAPSCTDGIKNGAESDVD